MAAIEKLLTMGLAHGADPTRMLLGAFGGSPQPEVGRMTWEDVTRAVVTLPHAQRAALYLRSAPELASGNELASLTNLLFETLIAHDTRARTYTAKDEATGCVLTWQALFVRTVLDEYRDPRTCRRCQGEGKVLDYVEGRGMVPGTCGRCEGKGWRPWSDNQRARLCQVRRSDWTLRYATGYDATLRMCTTTYKAGAKGLKQALFGGEDEVGAIERRLQAGV